MGRPLPPHWTIAARPSHPSDIDTTLLPLLIHAHLILQRQPFHQLLHRHLTSCRMQEHILPRPVRLDEAVLLDRVERQHCAAVPGRLAGLDGAVDLEVAAADVGVARGFGVGRVGVVW